MSHLAISERPVIVPSISLEESQGKSGGLWFDRVVQNAIESPSQVQIVGTRILGGIALAVAGVVTGLAAFSIVPLSVALVAIPATTLAVYSFWSSAQVDDYEDSEMLAQLKEEAEGMSLNEVVHCYGWEKVFEDRILSPIQFTSEYRKQVRSMSLQEVVNYYNKVSRNVALHRHKGSGSYFVPHPREEAYKWHREIEGKTFKEIIENYPLDQYETLGIIGHNEMQKIRELRNTYQIAHGLFKGYEDAAKVIFKAATADQRAAYKARIRELERGEAEDPFIRERDGLANRKLHSELRIQNLFGEQLRQVREQHEQAIALLSVDGRPVIRKKLSAEQREEYDRLGQELFENEQQIRQAMHTALTVDRAYFAVQGPYLRERCDRIHARFEQQKLEAKANFDAETAGPRQVQEETLAPHLDQFNNIVGNLTEQYRIHTIRY